MDLIHYWKYGFREESVRKQTKHLANRPTSVGDSRITVLPWSIRRAPSMRYLTVNFLILLGRVVEVSLTLSVWVKMSVVTGPVDRSVRAGRRLSSLSEDDRRLSTVDEDSVERDLKPHTKGKLYFYTGLQYNVTFCKAGEKAHL